MKLSLQEIALRQKRFREAQACMAVEGTGLSADSIAMFKMFDRLGWNDAQRRDYIRAQYQKEAETALSAE